MMHIIEIIIAIVVIDFFIVWLVQAFEKFNRIKAEHKKYVKEFVKLVNGKDALDTRAVKKSEVHNGTRQT